MIKQDGNPPAVQAVGSVSIVKARNSLLGDCLSQCRQEVAQCLANKRALIVLDMSESPLVNSEGLEFIVDAQRQCLARGGKLVVAGTQPLCTEILRITGVDECVAVLKDLRMALSDFAK